jgi:Tfp pilus assembly protein PilX
MSQHTDLAHQHGAVTLMVAVSMVILASLTSLYSARSVHFDQLASYNHGRASQARLAATAALAHAQSTLANTPFTQLFSAPTACPAGVSGKQWECSAIDVVQPPAMQHWQLSAVAVRDLLMSPHVVTLHAKASYTAQTSQAHVRESVFIPALPPAPGLAAPAALVMNGCISEAAGASLRVCPLVSKGELCSGTAKAPVVHTHFVVDTNNNGAISSAERQACMALSPANMPGGGTRIGPATAVTRSPCKRAARQSVLGSIDDTQLQAWSSAQERHGLSAHTNPPRSIYWVDSAADWHLSVGTPEVPVLLVFSAKACDLRCPHIAPGVRIMGSVLIDSGCNDEKMRGWQGGRIEGQLVVESGLPEWRSGTVLATPQGRDAYILNWPSGIDASRVQRVNGSWSEGSP